MDPRAGKPSVRVFTFTTASAIWPPNALSIWLIAGVHFMALKRRLCKSACMKQSCRFVLRYTYQSYQGGLSLQIPVSILNIRQLQGKMHPWSTMLSECAANFFQCNGAPQILLLWCKRRQFKPHKRNLEILVTSDYSRPLMLVITSDSTAFNKSHSRL